MDNAKTVLEEYAEPRERCYLFFSHFFGDQRSQAVLDVLPDVEAFIRSYKDFTDGVEEKPYEPLSVPEAQTLEREYARLFYGVGEHTIPLSESVYRSEEGLLCQGAWKSVNAFYAKHGLSTASEKEMEADSLSVEMAFASLLIQKGKPEKDLLEFLDAHLYPVGCVIAKKIREHARNVSMTMVAELMTSFLQAEKTLLTEAVKA